MELIFNPASNKSTSVEIAENEFLIKLLKEFRFNGVIDHNTILDLEAIDDLPQSNNEEVKHYKNQLRALLMRCDQVSKKVKEEKASQVNVVMHDSTLASSEEEQTTVEPIKFHF